MNLTESVQNMKWDNEAIKENIRIWSREQKNPGVLWKIEYGIVQWHGMLTLARWLAKKNELSMPPIYFPSPRQCKQFIEFCKQSSARRFPSKKLNSQARIK